MILKTAYPHCFTYKTDELLIELIIQPLEILQKLE